MYSAFFSKITNTPEISENMFVSMYKNEEKTVISVNKRTLRKSYYFSNMYDYVRKQMLQNSFWPIKCLCECIADLVWDGLL